VNPFLLLILCSAVTYRVSRFIVLDTMIEGTRDSFIAKLTTWPDSTGRTRVINRDEATYELIPLWRRKIVELVGCPWCVTIWVGAAVTLLTHFIVEPVPAPILWWLTISSLALVLWAIIDAE
jgi:hypothetical protein